MGSPSDDAYWNAKIYVKNCPSCYEDCDDGEGQCDQCGYMFDDEDD
jgi:hypothetical protein